MSEKSEKVKVEFTCNYSKKSGKKTELFKVGEITELEADEAATLLRNRVVEKVESEEPGEE